VTAFLFDVDGTLVDSNDAHAAAWVKAFAEEGVRVDREQVRRSIGMGGDKLMPAVSGLSADSPEGTRIGERRKAIFRDEFLPHLRAFPGAADLIRALQQRRVTLTAASSARRDELRPLLAIADASALLGTAASGDDVEESKPAPDIVSAALRKLDVQAEDAVMIGDTPYDIEAAHAAGVRCIAFRCGGWSDEDLANAVDIYDGPADLLAHLDRLLGGVTRP
jgi:HAD superfamily hydrolase (TIGR01509 family)